MPLLVGAHGRNRGFPGGPRLGLCLSLDGGDLACLGSRFSVHFRVHFRLHGRRLALCLGSGPGFRLGLNSRDFVGLQGSRFGFQSSLDGGYLALRLSFQLRLDAGDLVGMRSRCSL